MKTYALDASAVLCMLGQEPGGKRVAQIFKQAADGQCKISMSAITWGEVAYQLRSRRGENVAKQVLEQIERLDLQIVSVHKADALAAAEIKALHHLHYADSFVAALAMRERAVLVTADEHFQRLGKRVKTLQLR
jgi:predicted nucleic acid-binding protein